MTKLRNQKMILFALLVLLAAFAGCKGESPTAPDPTPGSGGGIPGGGTTPPVGATVALTATNASPLAASTTTITATVAQGGQPVPNGTAVEFSTNFGSFSLSDPNLQSIIRTTTNGIATVTLTAPSPGPAIVTAVVNNVSARTTITFQAQQVPPVTPSTSPTITSISPGFGRPAGGETITINGTNFRAPARVIFDFGSGVVKDAFVVSVTPTQIVALTPPIDVTSEQQQRQATITVIVDAGTTSEQKVTSAANAFTFQATVLTPTLITASPASGPIDGGTRVTLFGDGFQAPVQVFFNAAEAQVISITFNQIIVMSPTARDTAPNASGPVTGPVNIRVLNVASNKDATLENGFRYIAHVQITANAPGAGTAFGGTRVRIDGTGFNDPVAVTIGTIPAQVISVNNSEIIALTGRTPIPCSPPTGPVVVTNIDNGDSSTGGAFSYIAEKPAIIEITPTSVTEGSNFTVRVLKPGVGQTGSAVIRIGVGTNNGFATPAVITNPEGPLPFTVVTPTGLTFPTEQCTTGGGVSGTRFKELITDVVFTNQTTGCTDTVANALHVQPSSTTCNVPVTPTPTASIAPSSLCGANAFPTVTVAASSAQQIVVSNSAPTGGATLQVTSVTVTGANSSDFTVSPTTLSVPPGNAAPLTVTFTPTATGVRNATLTIFTNDPMHSSFTVCLQGTGS